MRKQSSFDDGIELPAIVLTLAVSLLTAARDYPGGGFVPFVGAATPLPALVAIRIGRRLRRRRIGGTDRASRAES